MCESIEFFKEEKLNRFLNKRERKFLLLIF